MSSPQHGPDAESPLLGWRAHTLICPSPLALCDAPPTQTQPTTKTPPARPKEIGVGLVSFGVFFLFLGVILFFDAALLALGNVLFTGGITLLIGPQKTFYFFARKQKIRGTVCFFTGMLLVFMKWTFIGMIVEAIGFLNLFGCVGVLSVAGERMQDGAQ